MAANSSVRNRRVTLTKKHTQHTQWYERITREFRVSITCPKSPAPTLVNKPNPPIFSNSTTITINQNKTNIIHKTKMKILIRVVIFNEINFYLFFIT